MFINPDLATRLAREHHGELLARASRRRDSPGGATPQTPGAATRIPRGLAAASLAAAAALVVAACGSTPGPTPALTSYVTSSSATLRADSPYPYAPGGVTYYRTDGGAVETFSIPAGAYSLNENVSYDPANDPDGSGECLFGGELDYLSGSGGVIPLGDGSAPLTSWSPINTSTEAPYPAGDYRLYIYATTTCSWTFELWPDN